MKKLLLVSFLACFVFLVSGSVVADNHVTNEGSSVDLQVGWMHSSVDMSKELRTLMSFGDDNHIDNLSFNMWKVAGTYKYQLPEELYGRASVFYAGSGTEKKNVDIILLSPHDVKYKLKMWGFQVALGWTFAFADAGMISPFLAFAFENMRLKGYFKEDSLDYLIRYTLYGFLIKLGLDLQYMFANNFSAGVIAMLGLPVNNKLKLLDREQPTLPDEGKNKIKIKNNLTFEVIVPVKYHIEDWTIGLEGSYSYRCFEAKEVYDGDLKRHNFGLALTGGLVF